MHLHKSFLSFKIAKRIEDNETYNKVDFYCNIYKFNYLILY